MAVVVVFLELILSAIDISALLIKVSDRFRYLDYLTLYGIMILVNLLFFRLARPDGHNPDQAPARLARQETILLAYLSINMTWGSLVSLLDQALYGQLIVFMVNMIANSVVFIVPWRKLLIPYAISSLVLFAGLPFFQPSSDILVGHYANLAVFIIISWIASRLLYRSYVLNLESNLKLEKTVQLLEAEISQNQLMNEKLSQANLQLRHLSLIDELTGLANRRGLRHFISQSFEQPDKMPGYLAAMMIDIDHFKQYNDHDGHIAGDEVLVAIANVLSRNVHSEREIAARWGGEEFILLVFQPQPQPEMPVDLAEKIRQQVEELGISHRNSPSETRVTVSIGLSIRPVRSASDTGPVIAAADQAMYEAKRSGRNRIVLEPAVGPVRLIPVTTREQTNVVAELAREIWEEHYTPIIGAVQVNYMLSEFQSPERIWQDIQANGYQYDLLEVDGKAAGYMAAKPDDAKRAYFLSKLYVAAPNRRQGLAKFMLDHLLARCRQKGYDQIWLTVNKNNTGSIAAYQKLGFTQADAVVTDIGGGFVMDDYIMTLSLQGL